MTLKMSRGEILKRIKELEEEIDYNLLQGCGYAIESYLLPELNKHRAMLDEDL